jgi:hypothetical protein
MLASVPVRFRYNPTTDVVRLLMNMQQSLIRAHSGKKNEAPTGAAAVGSV